VLLADRRIAVAHTVPACGVPPAVVAGGARLRGARLRSRAAPVEPGGRPGGGACAARRRAVRLAGTAGADRRDAVFLDHPWALWSAAPSAARPRLGLACTRVGGGGL